MNKESEELACLYVLDQLDDGERSRFEERLIREPDLAVCGFGCDTAAHFRHARYDRQRPGGRQDVERSLRIASLEQPEQRLGHDHVADPRRSDD